MNSFANYGLPMGIFAHQLTNYSGGIITLQYFSFYRDSFVKFFSLSFSKILF
jgi:hypothetical protein